MNGQSQPQGVEGANWSVWVGLLGVILVGMMFGTSIFQMVVEVPNWAGNLPQSARTYATMIKVTNPGHYYKILHPLAGLALLVVIVYHWRRATAASWWALLSIVMLLGNLCVTFVWVYPLNDTLFFSASTGDAIIAAAEDWKVFHMIRIAFVGMGVLAAARSLVLGMRSWALD